MFPKAAATNPRMGFIVTSSNGNLKKHFKILSKVGNEVHNLIPITCVEISNAIS